jgi:hypothetical protein
MRSPIDREHLAQLVADMTADPTKVVSFYEAYRLQLEAVVRRHLHRLDRRDLAVDPDEVGGLAIEAAFELQERARSWNPEGGALPWNWAANAIGSRIARYIGHARADVEIERVLTELVPCDAVGHSGELDDLARRAPIAALLRRAIASVASERDAEVHIEYQ